MRRTDFRHLDRQRVRWAEIDMQRIVFNGHYLMYFDTAVAGYWRALALPYHETMDHFGGDLFVRKATVEYLASARYDDVIDVGMRVARIGRSSILFAGCVFRGDKPLVTGELVYVFADPATQTSRPVPGGLRALLEGFENGEAMLKVETGSWAALGHAARPLRRAVFVEEQAIPEALEDDGGDGAAVHAVVRNRLDRVLGTGRLLRSEQGLGRIGRMAVADGARGGGVGSAVLQALTEAARQQGITRLVLHAQLSAVPFYRRAGFVTQDPPFEEAGIMHQAMVRNA